ncbi:hypothetical protein M8818_000618 [Zalaria obscura]|uniref:Uncharacterized protein n=1 Tax=Zalaria obscura TaxID=2024903 RepID=A0ACC3SLY1_9PEZI
MRLALTAKSGQATSRVVGVRPKPPPPLVQLTTRLLQVSTHIPLRPCAFCFLLSCRPTVGFDSHGAHILPTMLAPRMPPLYLILAFGAFSLLLLYYRNPYRSRASTFSIAHTKPANATLGFGGLYVVSGPGSPRRAGMIQAANVTELDLTIPEQHQWTAQQIANFKYGPESKMANGSIMAWMSHHVVLREFLKSGAETALVFEDDVDWDIHLRTYQVPVTAAAVKSLLPPAGPEYYWGHPEDWELLYLGHCGDYFNSVFQGVGVGHIHPEDLQKIPHAIYQDATLPDRTDLHPYTASLLSAFSVPEQTRVVHKSKFPLCTFGYAVTRASAQRLLEDLAPAKEKKEGSAQAYDIAIVEACRDKGLRCYSINPELFHHMEGTSLIDGKHHARPPVDAAGLEQVRYRNETANIGCGFWSKDFAWGEDLERLEYLREEVGRKGRCLKEGRDLALPLPTARA